MNLNTYFDRIVLINMERRSDRRQQCEAQFHHFGCAQVTLFTAHDMPGNENSGCTASHRGVLELICHHRWQHTLILEDDFEILHGDFNQRLEAMMPEVPGGYDMLYLGGGYGENPKRRVSPHLIEINHMKTTSSYAVSYDFARRVAPWIFGVGPIDELYLKWHLEGNCYIFDPRLMIQREGFSDIQQGVRNHGMSMLDMRHSETV